MEELEAEKTYQKVYRDISNKISSRVYKVDDRLPPEKELAKLYGVGRPTIREAMIALEVLGLVESRHGSGVYVTQREPPIVEHRPRFELPDIAEARLVFEVEAAGLAAVAPEEQDLDDLRVLVSTLERGGADASGAERDFHLIVARAAHNVAVQTVVRRLLDHQDAALAAQYDQDPHALPAYAPSTAYAEVLAALEQRDPPAARRAMQSLVALLVERLLEQAEAALVRRTLKDFRNRRDALIRRIAAED
nr:GntR family transcriptional regulator [uncultured Caulobacter sp.]